uniref:Uncharacterized protein n=1 Tax=Picea glauca TaxID=3330 RepID=A0A101LU99_PICGL|nr:hypothetical protein ABT39_MTgene3508 [Picea glauca]
MIIILIYTSFISHPYTTWHKDLIDHSTILGLVTIPGTHRNSCWSCSLTLILAYLVVSR